MLENDASMAQFDLDRTQPAGFWIRVAAYMIDFLILLIPTVGAFFMKSVVLIP